MAENDAGIDHGGDDALAGVAGFVGFVGAVNNDRLQRVAGARTRQV